MCRLSRDTESVSALQGRHARLHQGLRKFRRAGTQGNLAAAFEPHPERFVRGTPRPPVLPEAAWINRPKTNSSRSEASALAEKTPIPRVQGDGSMPDRRSCAILEADFLDPAHDRPATTLNSFRRCLKIMDTFRWRGYLHGRTAQWKWRGLTQACRKLTFICVSQQTENC